MRCRRPGAAHTATPACLIAALTQQCWRAGALHSLQRLAATCDLVVVTSRQHCIREPTLQWIERHFPGVFAEVHFGNHWALEGQSKAKSEICRRAFLARGASLAVWQVCLLQGQRLAL